MEQKSDYLELTIISAEDLERKWLSGDQTVAKAWVDPSAKKTTSIVSGNGSSVQWHEKLILTLNGVDTSSQKKLLTIEIHARGACGDSLLGCVYVPLVELVSDGEKSGNTISMYEVVQPSGKRQGSMKFLAKVVRPRVSSSIVPLPSAPPVLPLEDDHNGLGSNVLYPPANALCPLETDDERFSSDATDFRYPKLEVSSCPLQCHFSKNYATGHDARQQDRLPDPSYGMVAYPPHVYPPVCAAQPPRYPTLEVSSYPPQCHFSGNYATGHDARQQDRLPDRSYGMVAYPPHVYPTVCTAQPPRTSVPRSPHSNYAGMIPYPPPLETPYLPPASVYPPPTLFSEAPYPPRAPHPTYPLTAPRPSEMYAPTSFNPYSSPSYPPPYQATFLYPYASYGGRSF